MDASQLTLFGFIPEALIHSLGIAVMVVMFLAGLAGVATMAHRVAGSEGVTVQTLLGSRAAVRQSMRAAWFALGHESLGQRRFRQAGDVVQASVPLVPPPLAAACR